MRFKFLCLASCLCILLGSVFLERGEAVSWEQKLSVQVTPEEKRTFLLFTPPGNDAKRPLPLLLVFHGGTSTGKWIRDYTQFSTLAMRERFLVAYPDAYSPTGNPLDANWNDGRSSTAGKGHDIQFVGKMIDYIGSIRSVDTTRVYATGFSNGGILTQRLACEMSDRIAAFAPVAGSMAAELKPTCSPKNPVSILHIHGTADPFVPYKGGPVNSLVKGDVAPVEVVVSHWAKISGCSAMPKVDQWKDRAPFDKTTVTALSYVGCKDNVQVVHDRINGGGHTWPGAQPNVLPSVLAGPTSQEFRATEAVWTFCRKHRLKAKP